MADFFDLRAAGYEEHMREELESFDAFYAAIGRAIPATKESMEILDLGIGTGLEVPGILDRVPNAAITGFDVSARMLELLQAKFVSSGSKIRTIQASFLDADLGQGAYDAVVSSMALHHWLQDRKLSIYRKIYAALRAGGMFVNGDYIDNDSSREPLPTFPGARGEMGAGKGFESGDGLVHIDHPLSVDEELALLAESGFRAAKVVFQTKRAAILVAHR